MSKEIIEKMAKDTGCPSRQPCEECLLLNECDRLLFAERLYNKNYREIQTTNWLTKGISDEQLKKERDEALKEFFERHCEKYGYRKQEWISVDEELPEAYEDVLYFNGQSVGVDFICSDGTWCDEEVHNKPITHWMPLPEAPKMKGGAE